MKTSRTFCLICAFGVALAGCIERSDTVSKGTEGVLPSIESSADLERLLVPGMPTNEIVSVLGPPTVMTETPFGAVWDYVVSPLAVNSKRGVQMVGVSLSLTNDHLEGWGGTYAELPPANRTVLHPSDEASAASPVLRFYVVSDSPIVGGRFIDTEEFPRLGFVPPLPLLTIRRLKAAAWEESPGVQATGGVVTWRFNITLTPEDAARCAQLTETNVGKKILIMAEDNPLMAPVLRAPLTTGTIAVECTDRNVMESLKKNLSIMQRATE